MQFTSQVADLIWQTNFCFVLLTASDFTMYPFATQNAKDFENLLSVYLDAAFFPQLREQDFRLVCWHYIGSFDCHLLTLTM